MKHPLHEAIFNRKKSNFAPKDPAMTEEEQNKKQDLAPSVHDAHKRVNIDVSVEGSPKEEALESPHQESMEGDAGPSDPSLAVLMGKEPSDMEIERLKGMKPRSLMERAQVALLKKKG